jgi:hypothetical protein
MYSNYPDGFRICGGLFSFTLVGSYLYVGTAELIPARRKISSRKKLFIPIKFSKKIESNLLIVFVFQLQLIICYYDNLNRYQ